MYNETTNVTENETINEVTGIEKATGIFYKVQTECWFTSLLSLLGTIFFVLIDISFFQNSAVILWLLGIVSMVIAAPVRIIQVWGKFIIGVGRFCLGIPIIPINFLFAFFFGSLSIIIGMFGVVTFGGVITVKKYLEEMR